MPLPTHHAEHNSPREHLDAFEISKGMFDLLISQYQYGKDIDADTLEKVKRSVEQCEGVEDTSYLKWKGHVPKGFIISSPRKKESESIWTCPEYHLPDTLTIFDLVSLMGYQELTLYFLDLHVELASQDSCGTFLLHAVADRGHQETLEKLFEIWEKSNNPIKPSFLDVRSKVFNCPRIGGKGRAGSRGYTALEVAAWRGYRQMVEQLLNHGADLGIAVHIALDGGFPEIACLLLERKNGAKCDTVDDFGNTMLHALAEVDNVSHYKIGEMDEETRKDEHLEAATSILAATDPWTASRLNNDQQTAWDIAHSPVPGGDDGMRNYVIASIAAREFNSISSPAYYTHRIHDCMQPSLFKSKPSSWFPPKDIPQRIVWFWLTETNLTEVLGYALGEAVSRRSCRYRRKVIDFIFRYLWLSPDTTGGLTSREPGFGFERLVLPGPTNEESEVEFSTLAIPFLSVDKIEYIENRQSFNDDSSLKQPGYCAASNNRTLRHCFPLTLDEYVIPGLKQRHMEIRRQQQSLNDATTTDLITVRQAWCWKFDKRLITVLPKSEGVMHRTFQVTPVNHIIGTVILPSVIQSPEESDYEGRPLFAALANWITGLLDDVNEYIDNPDLGGNQLNVERSFIRRITRLREEISMIRTILSEQEDIWRRFTYHAWPHQDNWPEGLNGSFRPVHTYTEDTSGPRHAAAWTKGEIFELGKRIEGPQFLFAKYKKRLAGLDEDAERVERSIQTLLDLRQKHIALQETHSMSVMSASVFAFTIITIVFTPLSFATSLFALPIDRFVRHQTSGSEDTPAYTTQYITKWLVTVELAALAITMAMMYIALKFFLDIQVRKGMLKPAWAELKRLVGADDGKRNKEGTRGDPSTSEDEKVPKKRTIYTREATMPTESDRGDDDDNNNNNNNPGRRQERGSGLGDMFLRARRRLGRKRETAPV